MAKPKSIFRRIYVDNIIWSTDYANEWKYIPISRSLIAVAKNIVYEKGARITITHPKNLRLLQDYLFQGNLVRINPIFSKPAPLCRPDIELHSETEEGLTKLIKDLGLPDK